MQYLNREAWYVLRTRYKFDQQVERALNNKQFTVLHPTYQEWSPRKDRKKLLTKSFFPGYLFVNVRLDPERHLELLKTLGVIDLLKNSQGPLSLAEKEIENVRLLEHHVGTCFHSPEFAAGDWVEICEGPLKGLIGQIDQVEKRLLRISLESIPGSIAIEVNPHSVVPLQKKPFYLVVKG